jgi:hypothetical protein
MIRHLPLRVTPAIICASLVFGVHCSGEGFTEPQLYCHEAAASLLRCCPGYAPSMTYCDQGSDPESELRVRRLEHADDVAAVAQDLGIRL